jgi:hypothetical protein
MKLRGKVSAASLAHWTAEAMPIFVRSLGGLFALLRMTQHRENDNSIARKDEIQT